MIVFNGLDLVGLGILAVLAILVLLGSVIGAIIDSWKSK